MTAGRALTKPPELRGFTYVSPLGMGGHADVFLYEQARPRRQVAVKVLLPDGLSDSRREQFTAEADVMAQLSAHPYIVTIFDAAVADDGRPYLVMEYYPGPHLGVRASYRLSVPEVLRMAIQLAGAVESAHRLGILHRDIKPANVLTSQYGRPGLTDFGIAGSVAGASTTDASGGMSIPWSPPEVFQPHIEPDERSDVYSLGATVWHLLAGQSPFDASGGDNRPLAMMRRITNDPPPAIGRDDVPVSLQRVLEQAMRKKPAARYPSAFDFARALQAVQQELQLAPTAIEVPDPVRGATGAAGVVRRADADATRLKPLSVEPSPAPPPVTAAQPAGPGGVAGTIVRPKTAGQYAPDVVTVTTPAERRLNTPALAAAGALVVAAVVAGFLLGGNDDDPTGELPRPPAVAQDVTAAAFVPVVDGSATRLPDGAIRFNWSVQEAQAGDFFVITRTDSGSGPRPVNVRQSTPTFELRGASGAACIDVVHVRSSGQASEPATICAPG